MIVMSLFLSAVAIVFGVYIAISPARAAKIWGWEHLRTLAGNHKKWYLRGFRLMGIVIALGGILNAIDTIWFH
jgi:hypothetical protein